MSRPRPNGEVGGCGWGVSRPRPRGEVGGLARLVSRPTPGGCLSPHPGGRLRGLARGVSRLRPRGVCMPRPRGRFGGLAMGVQTHTWGVSRPTMRGEGVQDHTGVCVSQHALRQTPHPLPSRRLLLRAVCILLECILVLLVFVYHSK